MIRDVVLTDVNDEQILPITHARNVYINESMTLEDYVESNGKVSEDSESMIRAARFYELSPSTQWYKSITLDSISKSRVINPGISDDMTEEERKQAVCEAKTNADKDIVKEIIAERMSELNNKLIDAFGFIPTGDIKTYENKNGVQYEHFSERVYSFNGNEYHAIVRAHDLYYQYVNNDNETSLNYTTAKTGLNVGGTYYYTTDITRSFNEETNTYTITVGSTSLYYVENSEYIIVLGNKNEFNYELYRCDLLAKKTDDYFKDAFIKMPMRYDDLVPPELRSGYYYGTSLNGPTYDDFWRRFEEETANNYIDSNSEDYEYTSRSYTLLASDVYIRRHDVNNKSFSSKDIEYINNHKAEYEQLKTFLGVMPYDYVKKGKCYKVKCGDDTKYYTAISRTILVEYQY